MEQDISYFSNPQYLSALISATVPLASLPSGKACMQLRAYAGVSQLAMAAACQVGLSSIARYESGTVVHSRALAHAAYRSLLAAFLHHAQVHAPDLAVSIRREWPAMKPNTKKDAA